MYGSSIRREAGENTLAGCTLRQRGGVQARALGHSRTSQGMKRGRRSNKGDREEENLASVRAVRGTGSLGVTGC